eukprot:6211239-Pleurochrysis_carterae.AAC.3
MQGEKTNRTKQVQNSTRVSSWARQLDRSRAAASARSTARRCCAHVQRMRERESIRKSGFKLNGGIWCAGVSSAGAHQDGPHLQRPRNVIDDKGRTVRTPCGARCATRHAAAATAKHSPCSGTKRSTGIAAVSVEMLRCAASERRDRVGRRPARQKQMNAGDALRSSRMFCSASI